MAKNDPAEYEVESIQRAKVVRKRGKKQWSFEVKWKGFAQSDNTWEPAGSFLDGSEHFIERFWDRVSTDGRDPDDMDQFKLNEEVFPKGPPRKKGRKSIIKPPPPREDDIPSSEVDEAPENEHLDEAADEPELPAKRRGRGRSGPSVVRTPGKVPTRGDAPEETPQSSRKTSARKRRISNIDTNDETAESGLSSSKHESKGTSSRAKKQKRGHKASESLVNLEDSTSDVPETIPAQEDIANDVEMLVQEQGENAVDESPSFVLVDGLLDEDSDHSSLFGSEKAPDNMDQMPQSPSLEERTRNSLSMNDVPRSASQSPSKNGSNSTPPRKIPAHRLRAANPRVKLIDEPATNGGLEKVIEAANSRQVPITVAAHISSGSPALSARGSKTATDASPKKPTNAYPRRDSSLMVFRNGQLVTKPRSSRRSTLNIEEISEPPLFADLDNNLNDLNVFDITGFRPPELPSASVLLEIAGFRPDDAAALEDYDEDAHGEDDPDLLGQPPAEGSAPIEESLPTMSPRNITFGTSGNGAAWKMTNIFSHISSGHDNSNSNEATVPTSPLEPPHHLLPLVLDSALSIPVDLKDIHPPNSVLRDMNKAPSGPPGKFYKDQHASVMLDALKVTGSYARLGLDKSSSEEQQQHFGKFLARLQVGELFMLFNGSELLAMSASDNVTFDSKLNVPLSLRGLAANVVVAHVVVEDHSAYAEAVVNADDTRWEA